MITLWSQYALRLKIGTFLAEYFSYEVVENATTLQIADAQKAALIAKVKEVRAANGEAEGVDFDANGNLIA